LETLKGEEGKNERELIKLGMFVVVSDMNKLMLMIMDMVYPLEVSMVLSQSKRE